MQLVMTIPTVFPNNRVRNLQVLIDTGCEANLVNAKLISPEYTHLPQKPIHLVTATGQPMNGGSKAVWLGMRFTQEEDGVERDEVLEVTAEFFLSDLRIDAIISYPWMRENRIGIFPHLQALALRDPFVLLTGEIARPHKKHGRIREVGTLVSTTTVTDEPSNVPETPRKLLKKGSMSLRCEQWVSRPENWVLPSLDDLDEVKPQHLKER